MTQTPELSFRESALVYGAAKSAPRASEVHGVASAAAAAAASAAQTAASALTGRAAGGESATAAAARALRVELAVKLFSTEPGDDELGDGGGGGGAAAADAPEDDDAPPPLGGIAPFAALANSLKLLILRDAGDVGPNDKLRYMAWVSTLLSFERTRATAVFRAALKAAPPRPAASADGEPATEEDASVTAARWDATTALCALDTLSFREIIKAIEESSAARHWVKLGVAASLLAEMVCCVAALAEAGDEDSRYFGEQLFEGAFRPPTHTPFFSRVS